MNNARVRRPLNPVTAFVLLCVALLVLSVVMAVWS